MWQLSFIGVFYILYFVLQSETKQFYIWRTCNNNLLILVCASGITKCGKLLLQSASGIIKCDRLYSKVRQALQSVTVHSSDPPPALLRRNGGRGAIYYWGFSGDSSWWSRKKSWCVYLSCVNKHVPQNNCLSKIIIGIVIVLIVLI